MRSKDLIEASNSIRGSADQQRSRDVPTQDLDEFHGYIYGLPAIII